MQFTTSVNRALGKHTKWQTHDLLHTNTAKLFATSETKSANLNAIFSLKITFYWTYLPWAHKCYQGQPLVIPVLYKIHISAQTFSRTRTLLQTNSMNKNNASADKIKCTDTHLSPIYNLHFYNAHILVHSILTWHLFPQSYWQWLSLQLPFSSPSYRCSAQPSAQRFHLHKTVSKTRS